jgi:hypothetical protein
MARSCQLGCRRGWSQGDADPSGEAAEGFRAPAFGLGDAVEGLADAGVQAGLLRRDFAGVIERGEGLVGLSCRREPGAGGVLPVVSDAGRGGAGRDLQRGAVARRLAGVRRRRSGIRRWRGRTGCRSGAFGVDVAGEAAGFGDVLAGGDVRDGQMGESADLPVAERFVADGVDCLVFIRCVITGETRCDQP